MATSEMSSGVKERKPVLAAIEKQTQMLSEQIEMLIQILTPVLAECPGEEPTGNRERLANGSPLAVEKEELAMRLEDLAKLVARTTDRLSF